MCQFLLKLSLFWALQLAILGLVLMAYEVDYNAYMAVTIDKHERAQRIPPPRLFLVGGSETTFGNDSSILEDSIGLPVVNMATQGGTLFKLREISDYIAEGDVVLLSFVYAIYTGAPSDDGISLLRVIEPRPANRKYLGWAHMRSILDGVHIFFRDRFRRTVKEIVTGGPVEPRLPYRRSAFNAQGDMVGHLNLKAPGIGSKRLVTPAIDQSGMEKTIDHLNRFGQYCRDNQIRVLVWHPPIPESRFTGAPARHIQAISEALERRLEIPQLNRPGELLFPDEAFFDTLYHLSAVGVEKRTRLLAERLKAALSDMPAAPKTIQ